MPLFDTFAQYSPSTTLPSATHQSLTEIHETWRICRPFEIRIYVFHRFLICPLLQGYIPFKFSLEENLLSLLLLDRLKDFHENYYVNLY